MLHDTEITTFMALALFPEIQVSLAGKLVMYQVPVVDLLVTERYLKAIMRVYIDVSTLH